MNQVFTKKKLAAALTLAFATGGAAVLAVAPVPGLVAAAQANEFADSTQTTAITAGVNVPVSSIASVTGQSFVITENVAQAWGTGNIVLTLSAGKWDGATATGTNTGGTFTVGSPSGQGTASLVVPLTANTGNSAASKITLSAMTLNTTGVALGTPINVSISSTSTSTGLTTGVSTLLATTAAPGVTVAATATTTPTYGRLGSTTVANTITVTETLPGSLVDSSSAVDEVTLTFPSGINVSTPGTTTETNGLTVDDGTATTNVVKYNVSNTTTTKGVLTIGNPTVYIPSDAAIGNVDVTVAVKKSDGSSASTTVTLFKVAASGTEGAAYTTGTTTAPTTYPTLYAGRATQTTGLDVAVKELVGGTMLPGGNVSLTFPTGVTAGKNYTGTEITADLTGFDNQPTAFTDTAGTADETGKSSLQATLHATDADSAAGKITFKLDDLDLADTAAVGDLNVTMGGNAGVTAGTVKIGSVIQATTTTAGSGATVTAGSTLTLPEISIVENKAGALVAGGIVNLYIANANGANLTTTGVTVKAYKADGTDISSTIFGSTSGATITASTGGVLSFATTAASTTSTGPVTIKISAGVKATLLSTASSGDVTAVIGGASATSDITPTSDEGAKAFKQTVTVGKIVAASVPSIPAATVTGTTASQTIVSSVVASGNDQAKLGTLYVAAVLPSSLGGGVFLKNSSGAWVAYNPTAPAYYASPVTLGTHSADVVSATDLSGIVGTQIYVGYGVGSTAFGVAAPWNAMLTNGTYNLVYTVVQ